MRHIRIVTLAVLATLVPLTSLSAQENKDPFQNDEPVVENATPPKEKVEVHLPTMELTMNWMDLNFGVSHLQARRSKMQRELKRLKSDPEPNKEKITKVNAELEDIGQRVSQYMQEIRQIPQSTKIEFRRWQQLNKELDHRRNQLISQAIEKQMVVEYLMKENEELKKKIKQLEAEK